MRQAYLISFLPLEAGQTQEHQVTCVKSMSDVVGPKSGAPNNSPLSLERIWLSTLCSKFEIGFPSCGILLEIMLKYYTKVRIISNLNKRNFRRFAVRFTVLLQQQVAQTSCLCFTDGIPLLGNTTTIVLQCTILNTCTNVMSDIF